MTVLDWVGADYGLKCSQPEWHYFRGQVSHLKRVLDIDDNVELISPYSEHYRVYGLAEFSHRGKAVWKDGVNDFNLAKNREWVASLLQGMFDADLVTVTTATLAEYARKYNKNVAVFPNAVDCRNWWPVKLEQEGLRVGWSGGISHYEDWHTIKEPLNRLLRKYRFTLVVAGSHLPGIVDEDLRHLVEYKP